MVKATLSGSTLIYVLLSAICFSGWNLLARKAGVNQYWLTIIVCLSTLVPVLIYGVPKLLHSPITLQAFMILCIAGVINGCGFIFYGQALGNEMTNLAVLLPILFGVMVLFSFLGGVWFFDEPTNKAKWIGVLSIILGIYLINQ